MVRLRLRGEGGQGHSRLGDNFFPYAPFYYTIFSIWLCYIGTALFFVYYDSVISVRLFYIGTALFFV